MTTAATEHLFDEIVLKSQSWVDDLMHRLEWSDPKRSYALLRATLHALRDRLTVEEAAQLGAQLPVLIRGIYYDGWKPASTPQLIRSAEQFFERVRKEYRYELDVDVRGAVRAVLTLLSHRVTPGEITDVVRSLPQEIRELWP